MPGGVDVLKLIYQTFIDPSIPKKDVVLKALEMLPNLFQFQFREWRELDSIPLYDMTKDWREFRIPQGDYFLVIQKIEKEDEHRGGTVGSSSSVGIVGDESFEVIFLRIWHELLHSLEAPADDMMTNQKFVEWLSPWQRIAFLIAKWMWKTFTEHNPKWQRLYYMFLTEQIIVGGGKDVE